MSFVYRDNHIPLFDEVKPSIVPCWAFHPLYPTSCTIHAMKRWLLGFWSGLPVYSMVHILPLLLFRYKTLLKRFGLTTFCMYFSLLIIAW